MTDADLARAAVKLSGLSGPDFARVVAFGRSERTLRYWVSGSRDLTAGVRDLLEWFVNLSPGQRGVVVKHLLGR